MGERGRWRRDLSRECTEHDAESSGGGEEEWMAPAAVAFEGSHSSVVSKMKLIPPTWKCPQKKKVSTGSARLENEEEVRRDMVLACKRARL